MTIAIDPLGRMVIAGAVGPVEIRSEPAQRLLAHLVLCPDVARRESIADRLWPDSNDPLGNLRMALLKLRASLGQATDDVVVADKHEIRLVDRDAFASPLLRLLSTDDVEDDATPVDQLLKLHPDQLFAGLDDRWIREARESYLARIASLLRIAAERAIDAHDFDAAARALRRWVRLDPWSHAAREALIRCLRASGDIAAAMVVYDGFRAKLLRANANAPNPALRQLYQELLQEAAEGTERNVNVATPPWARGPVGWVLLTRPSEGASSSTVDDTPYQSYAARFLALAFTDLIRELPVLERGIRDDALHAFTKSLREAASDVRGDVAWLGGTMVRIGILAPGHSAELFVHLEALEGHRAPTTVVREVNHFGVVRKIRVDVPEALRRHGERFADDLARHFREAYLALEAGYVAAYQRWVASAYDLLYEVVNVQLQISGTEEAIGRFWFSITDLPSTTFRYHIDNSGVRAAIDHLKRSVHRDLPVWLAVTSLILDEVPDGVFGAENSCRIVQVDGDTTVMRFDEPVTLLQFKDLPTLGSNTQFWLSERGLYDSDEIAAIDIATSADLTLQANCPVEYAQQLAQAIATVRGDLELTFLNALDALVSQRTELAAVVASHHVNLEYRPGPFTDPQENR